MSVTFYPATVEGNRSSFVHMIAHDHVNVSNHNGAAIANAIGVEWDYECGGIETMDINVFMESCHKFLQSSIGNQDPGVPVTVDAKIGQATLIDCGRREGYLQERVMEILESCREGVTEGATHVYAC